MQAFSSALKGREHLGDLIGEPYGASFTWLVDKIVAHVHEQARPRIVLAHETNDYQGDAAHMFEFLQRKPRGELLTKLSFGTKQEYPPLQAADILAYECGKRLAEPDGSGRRSWQALNPEKNRVFLSYFGAGRPSIQYSRSTL